MHLWNLIMIYYLKGLLSRGKKRTVTCSMLLYEASWMLSSCGLTPQNEKIESIITSLTSKRMLSWTSKTFFLQYYFTSVYQTTKLHISQQRNIFYLIRYRRSRCHQLGLNWDDSFLFPTITVQTFSVDYSICKVMWIFKLREDIV